MIPLDVAIYDDTMRLPLATWRGSVQFSLGEHGYEAATLEIPLNQLLAFDLYTRLSASLRVLITAGGAEIWEGRVEDDSIQSGGATLSAYGRWRALSDIPYTALWSATHTAGWRPVTMAEISSRTPDRYTFDTTNQLVITPQKGANYTANSTSAELLYQSPDQGARTILGVEFDYRLQFTAVGWRGRVLSINSGFAGGAVLWQADSGATPLTGSISACIAGTDWMRVGLLPTAGVVGYAPETGDTHLQLTNVRLVTSLWVSTTVAAAITAGAGVVVTPGSMANIGVGQRLRINDNEIGTATEIVTVTAVTISTFTATFANSYAGGARVQASHVETSMSAARTNGASVTCTVLSTARMYVGMRLRIGKGIAAQESVVVESITSATQFVATFVNAGAGYGIGTRVEGFAVYANEIAVALRDAANAVNAGALSSSNVLIQSPELDLLDEVYEDAYPADILTRLASLGDASGQRYEVGVKAGRRLYLRPQSDAAQAWHVDAADLTIQQTVENLANSVYATYQDADGRSRRTASQADSLSIVRYGLTRRRSVQADTTNSSVATAIAQTARDDRSDPLPRASVSFARAYTANGAQIPLWLIQDGDTITIRNLPVIAGATVDRIRTFRVVQVNCDAGAGTISVTPETPLPELEYLLARREAFGERAAGKIGA